MGWGGAGVRENRTPKSNGLRGQGVRGGGGGGRQGGCDHLTAEINPAAIGHCKNPLGFVPPPEQWIN